MNGCGRGEIVKGKKGGPAELKGAKLGRSGQSPERNQVQRKTALECIQMSVKRTHYKE